MTNPTPLERDVAAELSRIRASEDLVPFLGRLLAASEVAFVPLPDEMRAIIQSSPDFVSISPGARATWLQLETDGAHAALVVYRAGDGSYHLLSPA
jgi:hypothetical protein